MLVRQYDSVGELIRALEKTYVINFKTKEDVAQMWVALSQIRSLLPVQMSQEEEELMRERLWYELVLYYFLVYNLIYVWKEHKHLYHYNYLTRFQSYNLKIYL